MSAIAQWTMHHAATLGAPFQPARGRVPSDATLRRALPHIDIVQREHQLTALPPPPPRRSTPAHSPLHGYALDGKYVRGARTHGAAPLLVSVVQQHHAQLLAQARVPAHQHESAGVRHLLMGQKWTGQVMTLDAGLTHPALAAQMLEQGGHSLMVVNRNQARLYAELTWYFATPPLPCDRPWQPVESLTTGHGRLELRHLSGTDDLDG